MVTVLITGASRGIGLALAKRYASSGDRVLAFCRAPDSAVALQQLAGSSEGRVSLHALDVGDEESIRAAAALGPQPVDILINNAGVTGGPRQCLEDTSTDSWLDAFKVMTIGPLRVAQAFLPHLRRAPNPRIVTITSQIAATTWPMGGYYIYASTKAAVNRVMLALAIDLKDEATVALIHPGWVRTDMGGAHADLTVEESAAGIQRVIAGLTRANTGKFYKWDGSIHPW